MRALPFSRFTVVLGTLLSIACRPSSSAIAASGEDATPSPPGSASSPAPSASEAPPPLEASVAEAGAAPLASAAPAPSRCARGCTSPSAAYANLFPGGAHPCKRPSRTFPDVLPVGTFAMDRGCIPRGVIVGCCLWNGAEVAAERFQGWPDASPETRKAQALAWVREITFAFEEVLDSPTPEDFTHHHRRFSPPAAAPLADGGVVVTAWLREPAGMRPETIYTMQEVSFAPTGAVGRIAQIAEWMTR